MRGGSEESRREITGAIAFYESHGRDWLSVVTYLAMKATGWWPITSKKGGKRMRQSKETLETMVKGIRAKERELVERYEVIFPAYGTKERITVVPIMTIGVVPRISALKVTPQRYCDTSWRDSSIEGMTPETILLYAKVRVAAAAWMDGTGEFPTPETIR